MIKPEKVMSIRSLLKQGYSHRAIARMTKTDRRTVKKYAEENILPVYKKVVRKSQLKPYEALIAGWLKQEDYQATKIHELLLLQGFNGSYDIVQRHVKTLKKERDHVAYMRFETMPGQQAQVDFADFKIKHLDGSETTIYCFAMVLGYSRHMYIEFIDRCTMPKFLACHQHAFQFFGGIPAEILYDNMKNVVIKRLLGKVQWNQTFEGFAMHYGFKPLATPPYAPWVKGKVERPFKYIRERFWRGYQFVNMEQANINIRQWLHTTAIDRIHGTHKEKVSIRFEKEVSYLGELPRSSYDISEKFYRIVYKDCQISFDGNRYVLPFKCVGKKVLLRVIDGILRVFYDDKILVIYEIPEGKGQTIQDPRFYKELKNNKEQIRKKYRKPYFKAKATQGVLKERGDVDVMSRNFSDYDDLIGGDL